MAPEAPAEPAGPGLADLHRYLTGRGPGLYVGVGRGRLAFAPPQHAVLVLGPPRSGKTVGLVIPNVLAAPGAVVSTSTKPDAKFIHHAEGAQPLENPRSVGWYPKRRRPPLGSQVEGPQVGRRYAAGSVMVASRVASSQPRATAHGGAIGNVDTRSHAPPSSRMPST